MDMLKPVIVEISSDPIIPGRSGTSSKSGQRYEIGPRQKAYFCNASRYPLEGEVPVPDSTGPYRPGLYLLAGPCFSVGQYGLSFDDRNAALIPLGDAIALLQKEASAK